eukprot:350576-Chlamydomonas_euryale.AAC.12
MQGCMQQPWHAHSRMCRCAGPQRAIGAILHVQCAPDMACKGACVRSEELCGRARVCSMDAPNDDDGR